jgi:hypothetical protein
MGACTALGGVGLFLPRLQNSIQTKSIVGFQTAVQNERYMSGIFANQEKNSED